MDNGWVSIYRRLFGSDLWLCEAFTRGQAWVDLIGLASHKDRVMLIRGIEISVKRGQVAWSKVNLAKRWKWSRGKLERFLKKLFLEHQITQEPAHQNSDVTTLITIINYDMYQVCDAPNETPDRTPNRTPNGHQTEHQTDTKQDTNNNGNKVNNGNNGNKFKTPKSPFPTKTDLQEKIIENNMIESKDKILEFFEYRMALPASKRYKSTKGLNSLFRDLNGCRDKGMIISECLDEAMEREWLTPNPEYFKNNNKNNRLGNNATFKEKCERLDAAAERWINAQQWPDE